MVKTVARALCQLTGHPYPGSLPRDCEQLVYKKFELADEDKNNTLDIRELNKLFTRCPEIVLILALYRDDKPRRQMTIKRMVSSKPSPYQQSNSPSLPKLPTFKRSLTLPRTLSFSRAKSFSPPLRKSRKNTSLPRNDKLNQSDSNLSPLITRVHSNLSRSPRSDLRKLRSDSQQVGRGKTISTSLPSFTRSISRMTSMAEWDREDTLVETFDEEEGKNWIGRLLDKKDRDQKKKKIQEKKREFKKNRTVIILKKFRKCVSEKAFDKKYRTGLEDGVVPIPDKEQLHLLELLKIYKETLRHRLIIAGGGHISKNIMYTTPTIVKLCEEQVLKDKLNSFEGFLRVLYRKTELDDEELKVLAELGESLHVDRSFMEELYDEFLLYDSSFSSKVDLPGFIEHISRKARFRPYIKTVKAFITKGCEGLHANFPTAVVHLLSLSKSSLEASRSVFASGFQMVEALAKDTVNDYKNSFNRYDDDGNGSITQDEMEDYLLRRGLVKNQKELATVFNSMDADSDGLIDWTEFVNFHRQLDGGIPRVTISTKRLEEIILRMRKRMFTWEKKESKEAIERQLKHAKEKEAKEASLHVQTNRALRSSSARLSSRSPRRSPRNHKSPRTSKSPRKNGKSPGTKNKSNPVTISVSPASTNSGQETPRDNQRHFKLEGLEAERAAREEADEHNPFALGVVRNRVETGPSNGMAEGSEKEGKSEENPFIIR
ncbi:hypothetical protein AAMO2058_000822000 [Amorphochlora amoebiformis]